MDTNVNFPLQRNQLYRQIANRFEQLIVDESLSPGDKLPSERNLAERLGVSRTVIREVTRVLGERGLVEVRPGSGTFILKLTPGSAARSIELFLKLNQNGNEFHHLCEVRRTLEVEIAGLAAERASAMDIEAMRRAVEITAIHASDPGQFVQCDLDFHSAMAAATHNHLYTVLLTPITDLLLEFRLIAYQRNAQAAIEGSLYHHRCILDQICARNAAGARQAMNDHLDQAESLFQSM